MSARAYWCKGCSPDPDLAPDTTACIGCASPPVLGSVVRVGGHVAHRSLSGGGTYLGEVKRVTDCLGMKPDTVGVLLAESTDPLPTDYPIANLYPCVPPDPAFLAGLEKRRYDPVFD